MLSFFTLAQTTTTRPPVVPSNIDVSATQKFANESFWDKLPDIINLVFQFAVVLGIIMILYIGVRLIIDKGDPAEFKKHIKNLVYILIGFIILSLSYTAVMYLSSLNFY